MNLGVLISGTGSNLKALIDAKEDNFFKSDIKLVLSNKEAKGLFHGYNANIPSFVVKSDEEILKKLEEYKIDLIVLAGYLPKISEKIIDRYKNKIINIHPSLLPKYGGKGYYGMKVHEAVFNAREIESGVTIHYVNENLDDGDVILQEKVDIRNLKSPKEIAAEVLKLEHDLYKRAIKKLEGEI